MSDITREQIEALMDERDEREADMHARIRSGYDKTVADAWRAKVAEVEAERDAALAREAALRDALEEGYGYVSESRPGETLWIELAESFLWPDCAPVATVKP